MSAALRAAAAALVLGALGCASSAGPVARTQLEQRQFQTRIFEGVDPKLALRAAVNTLLDDGFIVNNADAQLGLVTATHRRSTRSFLGIMTALMTYGRVGPWSTSVVEANVKVEEFGGGSQVRASFWSTGGDNARASAVADGAFYQAFFGRLDKSLFLLKEKL